MVPHLDILKCFAPPYTIRGLLPVASGDMQIMCNDKLFALAISRDGAYDLYLLGRERVTMVMQRVPEKNILAEIGKVVGLVDLPD